MAKDVEDKARLTATPTTRDFIANERPFVEEDLYEDVLRRAFDAAGIDYGRADFWSSTAFPRSTRSAPHPRSAHRRALGAGTIGSAVGASSRPTIA